MRFDEVWYATETRVQSRSKLIVYDDIGTLQVDATGAYFFGGKTSFELHDLDEPRLSNQAWNSTAYLIANAAMTPIYVAFALAFYFLGDRQILPWLLVIVVVANATSYLAGRSTKWIVLTGTTRDDERVTCYFADGASMGWSGMLGGTKRVFDQLRLA